MSQIDSESRKLQRETDVATGYDPDAMEAAREAWLKAEAAARHIMEVADNEYFAALAAAKLSTKMDKMKPCGMFRFGLSGFRRSVRRQACAEVSSAP